MVSGCLCLVLLFSLSPISMAPVQEHRAAIESVPPNVSLAPIVGEKLSGPNINISPFLTNSLLKALVEDSDKKKRVQRYRDLYYIEQKPAEI